MEMENLSLTSSSSRPEILFFSLAGWWRSVKPRRWTLVLIIGAWTMTLGFLIRIIWGIGDNVDSIPVYAIQNLVSVTSHNNTLLELVSLSSY